MVKICETCKWHDAPCEPPQESYAPPGVLNHNCWRAKVISGVCDECPKYSKSEYRKLQAEHEKLKAALMANHNHIWSESSGWKCEICGKQAEWKAF